MKQTSISKPFIILAVSDIDRAKKFYTEVMLQKVWKEYEVEGQHVPFENGFGLQYNYKGIVEGSGDFALKPTGASITTTPKANSYQLAFEVKDIDTWAEKIKNLDLELVHDISKYAWGQRVLRFYDYDGHIIELGEVEELWQIEE